MYWNTKLAYNGGSKGGIRNMRPPGGQNCFNFMQFWEILGKVVCRCPRRVGAPFLEKSWICHWGTMPISPALRVRENPDHPLQFTKLYQNLLGFRWDKCHFLIKFFSRIILSVCETFIISHFGSFTFVIMKIIFNYFANISQCLISCRCANPFIKEYITLI